LKFPRNEIGAFDPNGTYSSDIVTQKKVKYTKEAGLCLGVAAIPTENLRSNGILEKNEPELPGCRLKPFFIVIKLF
jgi:hypothetical protein